MKLLPQILLLVFIPFLLTVLFALIQVEGLLYKLDVTTQKRLQQSSHGVTNDLDEELNHNRQISLLLAKAPEVISAIESNDTDLLYQRGHLFVEIGLDSLTFVNKKGGVVARGHDEFRFSDNLLPNPIVEMALQKKTVSFLAKFDRGAYILTATPILKYEELVIGAMIVGISLDDQLAKEIQERRKLAILLSTHDEMLGTSVPLSKIKDWDETSFYYSPEQVNMDFSDLSIKVRLFENNIAERENLKDLRFWMIVITLLFSFITVIFVFIYVLRLVRPVRILATEMINYSKGNRELTELPQPNNEIGEIARAYAQLRKDNLDLLNHLEDEVLRRTKALQMSVERQELLFHTTRDMTKAMDKFNAMMTALMSILQQIPTGKETITHLIYREIGLYGTTGYAHFQLPTKVERDNRSSLKMDNIRDIVYFFTNTLTLPEEQIHQAIMAKQTNLISNFLTIPIWQENELEGLIEIKGVIAELITQDHLDFIDTLNQSLMIILKNINFTLELEEKVRMAGELKTAAAVQSSFFPKNLPQFEQFQIQSYYRSATETGGDWFGFMSHLQENLYIMIGDVTGHGTPSALVTASASATIRALEEMYERQVDPPSPAALLQHLNKAVFETGNQEYMMTFFIARIDINTGMMTFANAGHNFPVIMHQDGKIKHLLNANVRLGEERVWEFSQNTMQLALGDFILFYTDGILENMNKAGVMLGESRFRKIILANRQKPLAECLQGIVKDAQNFYDNNPLDDDLTVLAFEVIKPFLIS